MTITLPTTEQADDGEPALMTVMDSAYVDPTIRPAVTVPLPQLCTPPTYKRVSTKACVYMCALWQTFLR